MRTEPKRIWSRVILALCMAAGVAMLVLSFIPAQAHDMPVPFVNALVAQTPDPVLETPSELPTPPAPPLSSAGQLFTPEIILSLVFLLTLPLTTLVGTLFRLEGATASIVANVILNALAKGVILVSSGQATVGFAVVAFLVGVVLDKSIYDLLTKPKAEKIVALEAQNNTLTATLMTSGDRP
jgi:hypothetical protein